MQLQQASAQGQGGTAGAVSWPRLPPKRYYSASNSSHQSYSFPSAVVQPLFLRVGEVRQMMSDIAVLE